jgi:transposase-like protein
MDDFFGKDGIFAKLFSYTMEQMLEAELSDHLGYERYEVEGRNSGNNRNGHYERKFRASNGDAEIQVPRDRNSTFEPQILPKYGKNTRIYLFSVALSLCTNILAICSAIGEALLW